MGDRKGIWPKKNLVPHPSKSFVEQIVADNWGELADLGSLRKWSL